MNEILRKEINLSYLIFAVLVQLGVQTKYIAAIKMVMIRLSHLHFLTCRFQFLPGGHLRQCAGARGDCDPDPHADHHQHVHPQHGSC